MSKRGHGNPEDENALKKLVYSMLMVLVTMELTSVVVVMLETVITNLATYQFDETSRAGPGGIKNFQSRDSRDGILQNPGIPGFFGTG